MITPKPEKITPGMAEKWLDYNKANRTLRAGLVEKYASDMKSDKWTNCAAPIWFYENGDIADGQHRLWAIVESGVAQNMLVGRGLSREDGLNIDTGAPRTLVDNARLSGTDTGLSTTLISICRGIEEGDRATRNLSNARRLEFVAKHREAAQFSVTHGAKGTKLKNAVVNAAIARAWYYEGDKERLARFGTVLSNGFAEGEKESAAIALRNYILTNKLFAAGQFWTDSFLKSQNVIHYFMRGTRLTVIKSIAEERYPLKGKPLKPAVVVKQEDLVQAPRPPKHNPEPEAEPRASKKVMIVGLWPKFREEVNRECGKKFDLRFFDNQRTDISTMERMAKGAFAVFTVEGIHGEIPNALKRVSRLHASVHGTVKAMSDRLERLHRDGR